MYFSLSECRKMPCDIELEPFRGLGRLVKLKIGSGGGIRLGSGPNFVMPYLPNLRHVVCIIFLVLISAFFIDVFNYQLKLLKKSFHYMNKTKLLINY